MNNGKRILTAIVIALSVLLYSAHGASAQTISRDSLGLYGARIQGLAAASDGSVVFATAEGPYGIFYANSFGGTWHLATGGDYEAGSGNKVVITSNNNVYATLGNQVYRTTTSDPTDWNLMSITGVNSAGALAVDGHFVFIGAGSNTIVSYNDNSDAIASSSTLPASNISVIALAPSDGYIYVQVGSGLTPHFYRTTYNSVNGALGGSWTDITSNVGVTSGKYSGVAVDPNDVVYVSTFNAGSGEDGVYASHDNGDSFSRIITTTNAAGYSFNGSICIIGSYYSSDYCQNFTALPGTTSESTPLHISPNLSLINPADADEALMIADVGVAKTVNLSAAGSSSWVSANTGLEGVTVTAISQIPSDKDSVFLATNQQCAFTNTFTNVSPTWSYPILPNGDGSGCNGAAVDASDNTIVYAGTARLYKGVVNTGATPPTISSWTLIDDPTIESGREHMQVHVVKTSSFLPHTLIAGFTQSEGGNDGRLTFYDTSAAYAATTPGDLDGKQIMAFEAVSATVMFAGAGTDNSDTGIYQSTDGGTNWSLMSDSDFSGVISSSGFSYDSTNDILYAATNHGLYKLSLATTATNWSDVTSDLPGSNISAIAVDPATGNIYAGVDSNVYLSTDRGASWSLYYEGLDGESTSALYVDGLVQGSSTGFYSLPTADSVIPVVDTAPTSGVRGMWNGNYAAYQFLELENGGSSDTTATVQLYTSDGVAHGAQAVTIPGNGEFDVALNNLEGYSSSTYGTVSVTFSGNIDGRISTYLPQGGLLPYSPSWSIPLRDSSTGTTYVGYNTFQASQKNDGSDLPVLSWLQIANLDSSSQTFTVKRYAQGGGSAIYTTTVEVPAGGRVDIEGGNENPGANKAGLTEIIPSDNSAPYIAQLLRYGRTFGLLTFVVAEGSRAGGGTEQWMQVSGGLSGHNWVELSNVTTNTEPFTVTVYDQYGNTAATTGGTLAGHATQHVEVQGLLANTLSGAVKITCPDSGAILANTATYYYLSDHEVNQGYIKEPQNSAGGDLIGSYNLNADQANWLRLFNTTGTNKTVTYTVYDSSHTAHEFQTTLAAKNGFDIPLHDSSFGATPDAYGKVEVQGSGILAEVFRVTGFVLSDNTIELGILQSTSVRGGR